ncbi:MAG TPA: acyclic terpene utilization AtuA family protein [Usitatibacter sp.]|nr:acyclic terpene utilization AtuA family protein [Usitatibacter sp.]
MELAVGAGAGFSGDRVDAPGPVVRTLIERGGPCAIIFEMLAERTLAFAQLEKQRDPGKGYEPLLELELRPILADCLTHGVPIVGNFGAANPRGAALHIQRLAKELGLKPPKIGVVEGDDLSSAKGEAIVRQYIDKQFATRPFASANVYQGATEIAQALREGAQVVVTGRVADPSLTVGPALAHYGWSGTDWNRLAGATMAGHLLECGAQVTGGYFADPGMKDVPDLANVGYPITEIAGDGSCVVTKASNTGGLVDTRTVKEQLLYELHDPAAYLTPDVVADISEAEVAQVGKDRVRLSGVRGHPRPATLKSNVFFEGGWLGDGEISYAGPNAEARARLGGQVIQERMGKLLELRIDLIGVVSILADDSGRMSSATPVGRATDVRLRVAAAHADESLIDRLMREVTALWTAGPAGGGGARVFKRKRLSTTSCYIPRELVPARLTFVE